MTTQVNVKQIHVKNDGPVRIIDFSNPPLNFISNKMLLELYHELASIKADDSVRVLVLTGGMADSFITHYDVAELLDYSETAIFPPKPLNTLVSKTMAGFVKKANHYPWLDILLYNLMSTRSDAEKGIYCWARCMDMLDTMGKPVIAAISGMCLGGGCEIATCCDFRFMVRHEKGLYKIGLPEVLVGIIPGGTGTPLRLPRLVGEANALEMLMTGNLYTPEEALNMGLINKVLDADDLMPEVMALARVLAKRPPLCLAAIRKEVREGARQSYDTGRGVDMAAVNTTMNSEDARRGMKQYVEKVSQYNELDLERALADAEDLFNGKEVDYRGK